MIAKQRERKCATCRYYESSPLWRKGWCRNPLLYDPQTNHLVEADRLSCSRTFIDYWEPREGSRKSARQEVDAGRNPRVAPSIPMEPTGPGGRPLGVSIGGLSEPPGRERSPQLSLVRPEPLPAPAHQQDAVAPAIGGQATEELTLEVPVAELAAQEAAGTETAPQPTAPTRNARYTTPPTWVDRAGGTLRVSLIGAILLALVALGAIYAQRNLSAADKPEARTTPTRPVVALIPTSTPRVVQPTAAPTEPPPSPTPEPAGPPVLRVGGQAVVSGLNGQGLRVRTAPGNGRITHRLTEGTRVNIKDGPREAEGIMWWDVGGWDNSGSSGWVAGDFLTPVEP